MKSSFSVSHATFAESTRRKGRNVALMTSILMLGVILVVICGDWSEVSYRYLLSRQFVRLQDNAQGYPEYCHRQTGIVFVRLPGGAAVMGSPEGEPGRSTNAQLHTVPLSPFLIAKYEVTQAQYAAVMSGHARLRAKPSANLGAAPLDPERPVERISWDDLKAVDGFLARTGLSLASEAQWEYACRAGQGEAYSGTGVLDDMAWHAGNSGGSHHRVGTKQANQFGLHDMHGNVWERCFDTYDAAFYSSADAAGPDPVSIAGSAQRIVRGGRSDQAAQYCRSAYRIAAAPFLPLGEVGVRPIKILP